MFGKIRFLLPLLFISYSSAIWPEQAEINAQLGECIVEKNEQQCLDVLPHFKGIPDREYRLLLQWSAEDIKVSGLRYYLINRFAKNLPAQISEKLEEQLELVLVTLLKAELHYLSKRVRHNDHDIKSIRLCLDIVGRAKMTSLFYQIAPYIAYPLIDIRRAAFHAMGRLDDDRMYPIIAKLSSSGKAVERTYALDALYYLRDERTVPILLQALKDSNKSVRYYAIRTLEKMQRTEAIPYFIRIVQSDVDNEVRIKAIQVLGDFKPRSAFYTLSKNMDDKDANVRRAILEALLKYRSKNASHYISSQLHHESEPDLKLKEIKALLKLGHSGGMQGLKTRMRSEPDTNIRLWAIFVTGQFKDNRGFSSVLANLQHKEAKVRVEAALALARYRDKKAVDSLMQVMLSEHEPYEVQSAAIYALGQIGSDTSSSRLFDLSERHKNLYLRKQIKEVVSQMIRGKR